MHSFVRFHRVAWGLLAIAMLALLTPPACAEPRQIGQIKTASGDAAIVRGGTRLPAKAGDPVYEKDLIETGTGGSIGITFIDNTVMSTGPNSEMSLDEYKFDSSNFNGSSLTDLRKGTLSV